MLRYFRNFLEVIRHGKFTNILLLFFYSAFTLFITLRHEPWADELQAWLVARDNTVQELFLYMRYEGHFLPWYLLLRLFAANSCPVLCMNLLSWALCVVSVAIFLCTAPFRISVKCLVLLSSGMLFWFPVVSRCYALIPILIFLLADEYPNRMTHPFRFGALIALLANSHAYMEGFCGILFLFWAIDWYRSRKDDSSKYVLYGMLIAVGGAVFAFIQVAPGALIAESVGCQRYWPAKMSTLQKCIIPLIDFAGCTGEVAFNDASFFNMGKKFPEIRPFIAFLTVLQIGLLCAIIAFLCAIRKTRALYLYGILAVALPIATFFFLPPNRFLTNTALFFDYAFLPFFIILLVHLFQLNRRMGWILLVSFLWEYAFAVFLFYFLPQRALTIFLVLLFCAWQVLRQKNAVSVTRKISELFGSKTPEILTCSILLYCAFTIPGSLTLVVLDIFFPFSGARDAGTWIAHNIPEDSTVLIPNYGITQSVISAYAPKHHILCVESGTEVTYCPLNRTSLDQYPHFKDSPHWQPLMNKLPKPHWFVCDASFFRQFPLHHMNFRIGNDLFDEVYRTPKIHFSAVSGEQYWIFSDSPDNFYPHR